MVILVGIALLLICSVITCIVENWLVILLFVLLILIFAVICSALHVNRIEEAVEAKIISEEPIIKRVSEKTGDTISYGHHFMHHKHYQDRDVIVGYRVKFFVKFVNGATDTIVCEKGSYTYNKLLQKMK